MIYKIVHIFIHAFLEVFKDKRYFFGFILLSVLIFWLLVFIPVRSIPGNDLLFQLSIMSKAEYLLLISLSLLTSISLAMNFYLWTHQRSKKLGLFIFGQGGVGITSGIIASVFGAATCSACLTFIFGLLGVGGVLFLLDYRVHITVFAIVILLLSLYFTSQKILGICKYCRV